MNSLAIACSLTSAELQQRRSSVLEKFCSCVVEVKELQDGYAYSLSLDSISLPELAAMIELERQCCPFLRFGLTVEPAGGSVWLELTGPPGTREFLGELIAPIPSA